MKQILITGLLLIGGWAHASVIYSQTFTGGIVTGGNYVGVPFFGNFTADPSSSDPVLGLTVDLNISGGYSGGFYISLIGPNGSSTVILLNQPNTDTLGLNIRFQDTGSAISSTSDLSLGTSSPYAAYGSLSGLNGQLADGRWTLYFADTTSDELPTLNSWSLNIDVVPEPVNVALGVFGLLFAVVIAARRRARKMAAI